MAVIGAGPRGTSVIERLIAGVMAYGEGARPLIIHVIEPHEPGPGHIWRTGQSRLFLMNTPCLYPTVVPVGRAAGRLVPSPVGVSFDEWRVRVANGLVDGGPDDADRAECASLTSGGFPSRALYGRYLAWIYAELIRQAPPGVTVTHHRNEALDLEEHDKDGAPGWCVLLDDGARLEVDDVVLALGHVAANVTPEQEILQAAAARHGLVYWPPAVPADVEWDGLPADTTVLIRGLGLNFFDAMIQLTEGRGGHFHRLQDGTLEYERSGREPHLVAASRRGVPYRAKSAIESYIPRGVELRFCTVERAGGLRRDGVQLGFDHDLWPLLHRDVLWAYYSTLCRTDADVVGSSGQFLAELDAALSEDGISWKESSSDVIARRVPAELRIDVEALAHPFAGQHFGSSEEFTEAVLAHLEADAAASSRGEDDPLKMAVGALNAGRSVIKQAVADGGISDASWSAELRGWFEPMVEGLASGPPPLRIAQLASLVRAGIVSFVGPNPVFGVDADGAFFRAASPWVKGQSFTARHLVEAMMPANRVATTLSPLLRSLVGRGTIRSRTVLSENGVPSTSGGLDVTKPPYRAVDRSGQPQESLFVLGLQLSSVQWGTAIAAEAGADPEAGARTLLDADRIAGAIHVRAAQAAH